MRKTFSKIILGLFALVLVLSVIPVDYPVQAAGPYLQAATTIQETLSSGVTRSNQYTTERLVGQTPTGSVMSATISSLPVTMPDLKTMIVCEWRVGQSIDGVPYLVTGQNLFSARVTRSRVSVDYDGQSCAWDPIISLNGKNMSLVEGPYLVKDPLNPNYEKNTVVWKYTLKTGGFLGFGTKTITVARYLRQIEGILQEYYVLDSDPGGDILIYQNYDQDPKFIGPDPVSAWDFNNTPIVISETSYGKKILYSDLVGAVYPITIDPTTAFYSSTSDGYLYSSSDPVWSTLRTAGDSEGLLVTSTWAKAEATWDEGAGYYISRAYVYFDTSSIGSGSTVTSVSLGLYGAYNIRYESGAISLVVQSGMPTYPHVPLVKADYYYGYYSTDTSTLLSGLSKSSYNWISLSTSGVSKTGTTKYALRISNDVSGATPTDYSSFDFWTREKGSGYWPTLSVTYTTPVVTPTVSTTGSSSITATSALLSGSLTDDGGESCSTRFRWGLTTGYGSTTSWDSGYTTGESFSDTVSSFSEGTVYHFAAEASNSAGSNVGSDSTLLTRPSAPTSFSVTPGNTNNSLTWTLGTGSASTLVRYKTTGYPTNTSDGTQIYNGSDAFYTHTSLTNGIPYYYSIWGYKSSGALEQYSSSYATGSGTPVYLGPPGVTTYNTTAVTQTSATLNGYLDSLSGYSSADCYFQYYTGAGTWTDNPTTPETLTTTEQFSTGISGLDADTLYHCRAVADGDGGTSYGADVPFTTGAVSAPTMTTQSATGISQTGVQLNGILTDDGGEDCTVWFQYGKTTSYGYTSTSAGGQSTGTPIYLALSGLDTGTTYHYRLVGQNSGGIGYGSDISFATESPSAPTCYTGVPTSLGATSATLQGSVITDGGVTCSVRFLYGINTSYGSSTGWQTGYSASQTFSYILSGLDIDTTYHYLAQVSNSGGTSNGSDVEFTTVFGAPDDFKASAASSTTVDISWTKGGDQTGIWMSTGSFPADRFSGESVYFGPSTGTTVTGLLAGTTYFFRSWSQLDDGTWSSDYSEDVATTPGAPSSAFVDVPNISVSLTEPDQYFQLPNGSGFSTWPGYYLVEQAATGSGIPSGSLWLIIAVVLGSVCGIIAWKISGSPVFVIVTIAVVLGVAAIATLVSLWILFAFVILGGTLAMILRNQ